MANPLEEIRVSRRTALQMAVAGAAALVHTQPPLTENSHVEQVRISPEQNAINAGRELIEASAGGGSYSLALESKEVLSHMSREPLGEDVIIGVAHYPGIPGYEEEIGVRIWALDRSGSVTDIRVHAGIENDSHRMNQHAVDTMIKAAMTDPEIDKSKIGQLEQKLADDMRDAGFEEYDPQTLADAIKSIGTQNASAHGVKIKAMLQLDRQQAWLHNWHRDNNIPGDNPFLSSSELKGTHADDIPEQIHAYSDSQINPNSTSLPAINNSTRPGLLTTLTRGELLRLPFTKKQDSLEDGEIIMLTSDQASALLEGGDNNDSPPLAASTEPNYEE